MTLFGSRSVWPATALLLAAFTALAERPATTPAFDRVFFSGIGTVNVAQDAEHSLTLSGAEHALARVTVEYHDGGVYIETEDDHGVDDLIVTVSAPVLNRLSTSGRTRVNIAPMEVDELLIETRGDSVYDVDGLRASGVTSNVRGDATIRLSGASERQSIDIAGTAEVDASALRADAVAVDIRGTGEVDVWAERELDVAIRGAGTVRYLGTPELHQNVRGLGQVAAIGN